MLAPQTSLQKLMQRIDSVADMDDEHEVAPAAAEPVVARREPARLRWLPIAAAVQGIAIAGLLAALWSQSRDELDRWTIQRAHDADSSSRRRSGDSCGLWR